MEQATIQPVTPIVRPFEVAFDEVEHIYWNPETKVPYSGVTTILKSLPKDFLLWWGVGTMAKNLGVMPDPDEKVKWKKPRYVGGEWKAGVSYYEKDIIKIVNAARKAHMKTSSDAKDTGTDVHAIIKAHIQAKMAGKEPDTIGTLEPEADNALKAFLAWEKDCEPEYLMSERQVCSTTTWYAGTLDLWANLRAGKWPGRWLIDFKTSSGIYPETHIQLSAYDHALAEHLPPGVPVGGRAGVRIPKTGEPYSFVPARFKQEEDFAVFEAALLVHRWKARCEVPE